MNLQRRNEEFLNNYIDEELRRVFFPLNLTCYLFLLPKYNAQYCFITPNGFYSLLISFIGCSYLVAINCYGVEDYYSSYSFLIGSGIILALIPYIDMVIYVVYFIILFILIFFQSLNMVNVVCKLQNCHRCLKLVKNKSLDKLRVNNWVCVSLFIGFHFFYNVYGLTTDMFNIVYSLQVISLAYLDVDIFYSICVVNFFEFELKLWISELECLSKCEYPLTKEESEMFDAHCVKMFQAYVDILSGFESFKKVFQIPIFLYILDNFIHTMLYVQSIIDISEMAISQVADYDTKNLILIVVWVFKNFFLLAMIGFACEKFYIRIDKADIACLMIVERRSLKDRLKIVCKNVSRVRVACFSLMSACGVFSVDAGLVLRQIQLVATYTVVLLQFAFL